MQPKKDQNRFAILSVLKRQTHPMTSAQLAQSLGRTGHHLSERTVRLYLGEMDVIGLTQPRGRRGRLITDMGLAEIHAAQVLERVGYLSAKIDQMSYRMTFDLATCSGQVVVNTSLVPPQDLAVCLDRICKVFADGYAMGNRVGLLAPGERLDGLVVPPGKVGFCTVCSITVNGVLLKHGIPMASRFGGLLEIRNRKPVRFVEMIHYDGTSIDPLEIFIRSGMTDYHGAIRDGNGLVGASFRELPEGSRGQVVQLDERLRAVGLGACLVIGTPGRPVLGLPASEGRIGAVLIGGLNPVAILAESGYRVESRALAGLLEYHRLFSFEELPQRLRPYL